METSTNKTLLSITNQTWKITISSIGVVVCGCIMFYGIRVTQTGTFEIYGCLGAICSAIFGCLTIRCPKCRLSLVWYAATKQSFNDYEIWLFTAQQCPKCGFPTEEKSSTVG